MSIAADISYLQPLFVAARRYAGPGFTRPLPEPDVDSSFARDDSALGPWSISILVRSSFSAGITHVHAFDELVSKTGRLDHITPWTLLRGALENLATAVWLMTGPTQAERRRRGLRIWAEDMRNRQQHEKDTKYSPTGTGKTGFQRRQEILQLGLGLQLESLDRPSATTIIYEAAEAANLNATRIQASWRVASGFAHGRYWPNLRASELQGIALAGEDFYLARVAIDDAELKRLSDACKDLLAFAERRYRARSAHGR